MRTTLNVEDDVLEFAKNLAESRKISVGQAVSELARKGIKTRIGTRRDSVSGLIVFDTPDDAPEITMESVQEALDQADLDEFGGYFPKP
jgi:hypothetical protein